MYRLPLALVGLVLIILGIFMYFEQEAPDYTNDVYNFSFSYPDGYVITESTVGTDHYAIRLVKEEDAVPPENGEGPTGITIDIYTNNALSLSEWVTTAALSNFALGDKTSTPTSVSGVSAVQYRWSGLYEGETTAVLHKGNVIAVSVMRINPEDHTEAYKEVLSSLTLK
ncbi:MAG: hypothetical protein KBD05_03370 [Candidatus Pacebacteria bacterium]|nr:hypothetical protein [Candidatus Paceibacterota bacterium]